MNVLLRSPHARAKVMLNKFTRMCDVRAFLTDEKERSAWENAGVKIDGNFRNFFEESNLVFVGTPEGQEAAHVEACLEHGSNTVLMGGANQSELLNGIISEDIDIPNKNDYGREFFFGRENYERFQGMLQS